MSQRIPGSIGLTEETSAQSESGRHDPPPKPVFDADKAVIFANKNKVVPKYGMGRCARHIASAIAAGFGIEESKIDPKSIQASTTAGILENHLKKALNPGDKGILISAKNFGPFLLSLGFLAGKQIELIRTKRGELVQATERGFALGDIIVCQSVLGSRSPKKGEEKLVHGHIQMFNGSRAWISDFEQEGFFSGPGYRTTKEWGEHGNELLGGLHYVTHYRAP